MNTKLPLFVAALCMMVSLNLSAATTLARQGMITTDDYATFLNTPEEEEGETSPFLEIEGAMHRQDCYDEKMAEETGASCLMRRGEPGNYFYECTERKASTSLHFMSVLDAELYCTWNNTALAPTSTKSSERDPLLKTNITTFQIQIAHDRTQETSLHQAMEEEKTVEPFTLKSLGETAGLVVACFVLGRNIFHPRDPHDERAPRRESLDSIQASNDSLGLPQSTQESNKMDTLQEFKNPTSHPKNPISNIPNNPKGLPTSGMGDTNPTNKDAQPSLKMSPKELEKYELETGRRVKSVLINPSQSIRKEVPPFASTEEGQLPFSEYKAESSTSPLPSVVLLNLDPDLVNNSFNNAFFRNLRETSTQEKFEESIEMIHGKGLFSYDFQERTAPVRITARLDGRVMLGQLAEGQVKLPLQKPSLQNTSVEEIFHNIAFALHDNISEIDEKLADLESTTADQANPAKWIEISIDSLKAYKEALEKGRELLQNMPEKDDINFFQTLMSNLHETFTLCEQAEQERLKGNDKEATYLYQQGIACLGVTEESASLKPRENIVDGYKEAFTLLQRAQEANNLNHQGLARFALTKELASPEPRENIVDEYNQAFTFFQRAQAARAEGNRAEANNLNNQGLARFALAKELASPEPRENIVEGYNQAFTLFQRAQAARTAGNRAEAHNLNNQGLARFALAKELASPEPREDIVAGYNQAFTLLQRAQTDRTLNRGEARNLNHQGIARLVTTDEMASLKPRKNIVAGYNQAFALFEGVQGERAAGNHEEASNLGNQGLARFALTKELASLKPRENIIDGYKEAFALFEGAQGERAAGNHEEARNLEGQARARFSAIEEMASLKPRKNIVEGYKEAFTLLQRAQKARVQGDHGKAINLEDQALTRFEATMELAVSKPNKSCTIS